MKNMMLLVIALFLLNFPAIAQLSGGGEANPELKTNFSALKKWQDMRFGMFIHWGPVSLRGTEISWSRGREIPIEEYDNLYREFNPVLFNAAEWVNTARQAGMKYLIITSKHHDGFCLWDSKYTDYDIMATPFRRDILRELAEECERQGILFGTYYSIADWHHPDYTTRYGGDPRPVEQSDMNRYVRYLKNQVKELIENYGTNILWFDGQWESAWTHQMGMDLYRYIRELRDDILINDRVDKGHHGKKGMNISGKFAGDFGTPEQRIGAFDPDHAWESCITLCRQWAWKPNDRLKSRRQCIQTLARTAGGGGNLLLNVGPMLDGRIEQRQVDRLKEMGQWLTRYGESIYGTRGGPYRPTDWMVSTRKTDKIYLHLFTLPQTELVLPELAGYRVISAQVLSGQKLNVRQRNGMIVISLPQQPIDEDDTVIVLQLDKETATIEPVEVPENILRGVLASNIRLLTDVSPKYPADGIETLTDNIRGTLSYSDGRWLGFEGTDFVAVIDFGQEKTVAKLSLTFLQDQNAWIFLPEKVTLLQSSDGRTFAPIDSRQFPADVKDDAVIIEPVEFSFKNLKIRYLKIVAENVGTCPQWHKGAGGKAWLFVDEIVVE